MFLYFGKQFLITITFVTANIYHKRTTVWDYIVLRACIDLRYTHLYRT